AEAVEEKDKPRPQHRLSSSKAPSVVSLWNDETGGARCTQKKKGSGTVAEDSLSPIPVCPPPCDVSSSVSASSLDVDSAWTQKQAELRGSAARLQNLSGAGLQQAADRWRPRFVGVAPGGQDGRSAANERTLHGA